MVTEVRIPRAPSPSRATSRTSGFSSASARSSTPSPVTISRPGHLRAQRGHLAARAMGAGGDRTGDGLLGDVSHVVQRQVEALQGGVQLVQRRAGKCGHGHGVAVHAHDAAQAAGPQDQAVGERDVGERVAGAGHLHGEVLVARCDHRVGDFTGVVRVELLGRMSRGQARPVGPRGHVAQVAEGWPAGSEGARPRSRTASPASAASTADTVQTQYAAELPCSSATTPASQAPGAMPALIPVCTRPIASLSRERGTDVLDQREDRDQRGCERQAGDEQGDRDDHQAREGAAGTRVPTARIAMPIRARSSGRRRQTIAPGGQA